ncbi:DUF2213 domain-containing protein [bacterium]|nr:DUF2213 domain-containing protein [bacterium]
MGLGTHSADLHACARLMVGAGVGPGYSERRTDSVAVSMGATPVETRPDGSKVYRGIAAFGDVVKKYPDLKPPRTEFIPADEAMSPEALATLNGLRFTAGTRSRDWDGKVTLAADHTPELDDPNGEAIEGSVLRGWREDSAVPGEPPALMVDVLVYTRPAQELLERGVRDLSFGFRTDEEVKSGVHNGIPYDRVQRNIRYYHLALVTSARSRTPSGRRARFDSYPTTTAAGETPPMKRTHLLLSAVAALTGKAIPPVPTVPALDDAGKPRVDASGAPEMVEDAAAGPALSEADAALLKQMSPEAQAALGAALGAVVAPAEEVAEEEAEVAADVEQDTEMLAPVLADIAAIKAALEAAGIKVGAPKGDEMPMPSAAKMDAPKTNPPARKDSAAVTTPAKPAITIDADAIIAKAEAAASKRFDANAAFVQTVRNDHAEVATVEQAATVMLTTIKAHLPDLSGMAEEALKGGRFDSLTTFYKQAEGIRRDSLLARQGADLGRVLASADLGTNGGGNVVRAPGRS